MDKSRKNTSSFRSLRVAELIREVLSNEFLSGKIIDQRLEGSNFFISRVVLSKDLKVANCYVRGYDKFLNDNIGKLVATLNESSKVIRYRISPKLMLKYSPEIKFFYDFSYDNAYKVQDLLKTISIDETEDSLPI